MTNDPQKYELRADAIIQRAIARGTPPMRSSKDPQERADYNWVHLSPTDRAKKIPAEVAASNRARDRVDQLPLAGFRATRTPEGLRRRAHEVIDRTLNTGIRPSPKSVDKQSRSDWLWIRRLPADERGDEARSLLLQRLPPKIAVVLLGKATAWAWQLDRVANFVREHGRHPSRKVRDEDEAELGRWLHEQRASHRSPARNLSDDRRRQLDASIPSWNDDVFGEHWDRRCADLRAFYDEHQRLPALTSANDLEHDLSRWLRRQREDVALSAERQRALEAIDAEWRNGLAQQWVRRLDAFVTAEGEAPTWESSGSEGRAIRQWMYRCRDNRDLPDDVRSALDRLAPGWDTAPSRGEAKAIRVARAFEERLAELEQFRAEHGRFPSSTSADRMEAGLGGWAAYYDHTGVVPDPFQQRFAAAVEGRRRHRRMPSG